MPYGGAKRWIFYAKAGGKNMSETVNQETTTAEPERTFTQAELDATIKERLARERAKYADYEAIREKAMKYDEQIESSKSELQRAQEEAAAYKAKMDELQSAIDATNARAKVSQETGVPANLLTGTTEEECMSQAEAIKKWHEGSSGYPVVPDKGEVTIIGGGKTRDQFAEWFSQNLKK